MFSLMNVITFSTGSVIIAFIAHRLIILVPTRLLNQYYSECKQALNEPTPLPTTSQYQYLLVLGACLYATFMPLGVYGLSSQGVSAIFLATLMITLSFIDWKTKLLPDWLVYTGLWAGLLLSIVGIWTTSTLSIIGAFLGYCVPWLLIQSCRLFSNREFFGYGDCKMIAMLGAWFGPSLLPYILLVASVLGLAYRLLFTPLNENKPIAFGPFISLAALGMLHSTPHQFSQFFQTFLS